MKNRLIVAALLLVLGVTGLAAQKREITNEVIATAGGSVTSSGLLLSWTIGEPIVTTLETTPLILTQGFHQPLDSVSLYGIAAVRVLRGGEISMYPNPARDYLRLNLPADLTGARLDVVDESGTVVAHYDLAQRNNHVDCTGLPSGTYLARLTTLDGGDLIATLPLTILR